jgi:hypothetical protein
LNASEIRWHVEAETRSRSRARSSPLSTRLPEGRFVVDIEHVEGDEAAWPGFAVNLILEFGRAPEKRPARSAYQISGVRTVFKTVAFVRSATLPA